MRAPIKRGKKNYIKIPNQFFNGWMKEVNKNEWVVLCFILRKTVGWNKTEDWIKYDDFLKVLSLSRRTLIRSLFSLEKKEMIFKRVEKYKGTLSKIFYRLNIEPYADNEYKNSIHKTIHECQKHTRNNNECHRYTREPSHECQKYTRDECHQYTLQNNNSIKDNNIGPPTGNTPNKQTENSTLRQLQEYYFEKLKAKIDNPIFNWGIAGKRLNELLKTQTEQEIRHSIDNFFITEDQFIIGRGWMIEDFVQHYNAYKAGFIRGLRNDGRRRYHPRAEPGKYDGLEE